MPISKKIPVGEHRLGAQYLELREILNSSEYEKHLDKRLGFWANVSDKRLPIALLNRTIREILAIPLDELFRYPSIGEKKFTVLVSLLARAASTPIDDLPIPKLFQTIQTAETQNPEDESYWSHVSEYEWNKWQNVVLEQGLDSEVIGRLCPSLEEMPRVLWNKPLRAYCTVSLDELREMKTHGEKRVSAILRLFREIFEIASQFKNSPHLRIRMSLRWTDELRLWLSHQLESSILPTKDEIFTKMISPLLAQLQIDAPDHIVKLAEARLGLNGPIVSVRILANELNLARARVYQLLAEISDIFIVRWPEGSVLVHRLRDKCIHAMIDSTSRLEFEQFIAATELFYPPGKTSLDMPSTKDYGVTNTNLPGLIQPR